MLSKLGFLRRFETALVRYERARPLRGTGCVAAAADVVREVFDAKERDSERIHEILCTEICRIADMPRDANGQYNQIALYAALEEAWENYIEVCEEIHAKQYEVGLARH